MSVASPFMPAREGAVINPFGPTSFHRLTQQICDQFSIVLLLHGSPSREHPGSLDHGANGWETGTKKVGKFWSTGYNYLVSLIYCSVSLPPVPSWGVAVSTSTPTNFWPEISPFSDTPLIFLPSSIVPIIPQNTSVIQSPWVFSAICRMSSKPTAGYYVPKIMKTKPLLEVKFIPKKRSEASSILYIEWLILCEFLCSPPIG